MRQGEERDDDRCCGAQQGRREERVRKKRGKLSEHRSKVLRLNSICHGGHEAAALVEERDDVARVAPHLAVLSEVDAPTPSQEILIGLVRSDASAIGEVLRDEVGARARDPRGRADGRLAR